MCGIAGVLNLDRDRPANQIQLKQMTQALEHRGPDGHGYFEDGPVGLGHRRLAILDVAGGQQPWLDADRALVYNGEIYNYRELMAEERASGAAFVSQCDTELLMHLAGAEDSSWLHRLNGMFAFAHWDRHELVLARDRVGIKPLYYTMSNGQFLFASEIKALLVGGAVRRINRAVVPEYLAFRNICGEQTLFEGINELPPGHTLRLRPGWREPVIEQWWSPAPAEAGTWIDPELPVAEQFRDLFLSSVKYRLISDVPVGTYNSGGVDSSLISAFVRQATVGQLHTFSVGFEEDSHDESRYAQIVADRLGTTHHTLVINGSEYAAGVEQAISSYDQPLFQDHTVQLMKLSGLAKQFVTVVLTGEGADELFAGYPRYQIPVIASRLASMPAVLHRSILPVLRRLGLRRMVKLFEISGDRDQSVLDNARFSPRSDLEQVGIETWMTADRNDLLRRTRSTGPNLLETVLNFDRQSYMPGLLHRLDRTTMVSGLEARVPFLDHRLLEWSMACPARHKMTFGRENKILVKAEAEKFFPRDMLYRRKVGFGVPTGEWLRQPGSLGKFLDVLRDRVFAERGICDIDAVDGMLSEHLKGVADHGHMLWTLVLFELWSRATIDQAPRAECGVTS